MCLTVKDEVCNCFVMFVAGWACRCVDFVDAVQVLVEWRMPSDYLRDDAGVFSW